MKLSKGQIAEPGPEELVERFFTELLAATAGVKLNGQSVEELGQIASLLRPSKQRPGVLSYLESLKPYRGPRDFQGMKSLPRPKPIQLHIERSMLYGHFRSWLRKQGLDPDTIDAGDDYWSARDADVYQSPKLK